MTEPMAGRDVAAMLRYVCEAMIAATDVLTDADLSIGDGDHGIGMRRGFEGTLAAFEATPPGSVEAAFQAMGGAFLTKTGGAAGAVFGTLFCSGALSLAGHPDFEGADIANFLEAGLAAVQKRGGATEGQKTVIDALAPAARAAHAAVGGSVAMVLAATAEAAAGGVEATKAMVATTGKARSLGERSIGFPDPGALSLSLILKAMQEFSARA